MRDSPLPRVKVHGSVVLSILNAHMRRPGEDTRVIGTLLGEVSKDGTVTVRDAFAYKILFFLPPISIYMLHR